MSEHKPSSRLPLIAAILLALAVGPCAFSTLALRLGGVSSALHHFEEGGWGQYLAILAFMCATVVVAVVGGLRGAGKAAPWSVAVFFALGPWVAGVMGEQLGLSIAYEAIANADAGSRATMFAMGYSEAANCSVFGGWLSASLFGVLALSAAFAARGEPATDRRGVRAAVTAPVALALLVPVAVAFVMHTGLVAVLGLCLAGLVSVIAVAVAGASIGGSESGRVGGSAIAAVVCAFAAVVFAGVAELGHAEAFGLGAVARADAASVGMMLSRGMNEHAAAQISVYALGFALVVALGIVGALAAKSGAAKRGAYIDGAVALVLLLVAGAIGLASHARRVSLIEPLADAGPEGVELVPMPMEASPGGAGNDAMVIGRDGLRRRDGTVIAWSAGRAALGEAFEEGTWSEAFLLDARANGRAVSETLAAAQAAGLHSVILTGGPTASATEVRDDYEWRTPTVLARFVWTPHQVTVDICDPDEGYHGDVGRITAAGELQLRDRDGGDRPSYERYGRNEAEFTIDPEASAENVVRALGRGYRMGRNDLTFCERPAT